MNIVPFNFNGNAVRVVSRNGEPWFVASDVCAVLELRNPSDAVKRLDTDEVTLDQIEGSHRPTNLINESGLYALVLRSDKPQAKPLRRFVTSEVLPQIRKTGAFGVSVAPSDRIKASREARLALKGNLWLCKQMGLEGTQAVIAANNAVRANLGVDHLAQLGIQYSEAPQSASLLTASDLARRLGWRSAQVVNKTLERLGLQMSFRDAKGRLYYEPTDQGREEGAVMVDTQKKDRAGTPIRQLRWSSDVLGALSALDGATA
ncbi:MAG: BRO family protein [Pseudomonadota bacterium]